LSDWC